MMKRFNKYLIIIMISIVMVPTIVFAKEETLGDLKNTLKSWQAKDAENRNKKRKTQSEINAAYANIKSAETEILKTQQEMTNLEEEINHTNNEIATLKVEAEELLRLYQKLQSENFYTSYITGASTMTELIMRIDAVKQVTEYNESKLRELESLIKNNEKQTKELAGYQVKLDDKIVTYEKRKEELGDELAELEEGAVTIKDEIANAQKQIKYFEDMGCKDDQTLNECLNVTNNTGWLKPVPKGRITSLYGYRKSPTAGASSNHKGIDIGVAEGTAVYPTANGVVGAIVERSSCGGNMLYIWVTVNGKKYTTVFMHLKSINVKVGDKVNVNQVVAYSGGGKSTAAKYGGYDRCTTGSHLHYGLASGGWYGSGGTYPLSKFNSNTMNPPGYPGLYQWFYSRL